VFVDDHAEFVTGKEALEAARADVIEVRTGITPSARDRQRLLIDIGGEQLDLRQGFQVVHVLSQHDRQ
jgi:hypothetical protein